MVRSGDDGTYLIHLYVNALPQMLKGVKMTKGCRGEMWLSNLPQITTPELRVKFHIVRSVNMRVYMIFRKSWDPGVVDPVPWPSVIFLKDPALACGGLLPTNLICHGQPT